MLWKTLAQTEPQSCKKLKCIYQHRLLLIIIAGAWVEVRELAANLPLGVNKKRRLFLALPFPPPLPPLLDSLDLPLRLNPVPLQTLKINQSWCIPLLWSATLLTNVYPRTQIPAPPGADIFKSLVVRDQDRVRGLAKPSTPLCCKAFSICWPKNGSCFKRWSTPSESAS